MPLSGTEHNAHAGSVQLQQEPGNDWQFDILQQDWLVTDPINWVLSEPGKGLKEIVTGILLADTRLPAKSTRVTSMFLRGIGHEMADIEQLFDTRQLGNAGQMLISDPAANPYIRSGTTYGSVMAT